jgi:acyl-CoA synthetase (AMP-forming)/AMP-acid ligase II
VVSPCYGLAEATLAVTIAKPFQPYRIIKVNEYFYPTVGRKLKNIEIKIEKENAGDPYGLIKICGNNVASGVYINGKEVGLSDRDGFLNTGDIGFFRGKDLVILGRSDDMFIINGENYFPYEIESYIKELKQVARNRVVCFDIPASKSSSGLVELVVIYETAYSRRDDLRFIESEIDKIVLRNMGLKVLKIIAVKPKTILITPSGKIQRNLMREEYMHGRLKGKYVE